MLSDRCLSVLSYTILSVTLVYCDQTVGRIKMKLGTQVGLSSGHIVLNGDRGPADFWPISVVAKFLSGSRCHLLGR